ncbi:MAG: hypothetical protein QOD99_3148 [Chthoniobacter sp.]|jgi:hypothetical protein|nr:hypothetical protein [Chthoniobacter sp.]
MLFRWCALIVVLVTPLSRGAAPEPKKLTAAEMAKAGKIDALTVPTPGELMAALNKIAKPNWQERYRQPIPTAFTSRPQIALNLGGLIADGYLAVEATDSQQVKNIGKDIVSLAKTLGVSENVLRRGKSITDFSENNDWSALKEELEATQNEVKLAMEEQHDDALVTLVTLGGWVRGTEVVSGWIVDNYSPAAAKLLRQPAVVGFLHAKMETLPEKMRAEGIVKGVEKKLVEIEQQVSFPREQAPTRDDVKKLKAAASEIMTDLSKK